MKFRRLVIIMKSLLKNVLLATVAIFFSLGAVSCSESSSEEYSLPNRDGFLKACTRTGDDVANSEEIDDQLVTSVCKCVLKSTEQNLKFEDFKELDTMLVNDPEANLPPAMAGILAECVKTEAKL
jgi:hypothetical protein